MNLLPQLVRVLVPVYKFESDLRSNEHYLCGCENKEKVQACTGLEPIHVHFFLRSSRKLFSYIYIHFFITSRVYLEPT